MVLRKPLIDHTSLEFDRQVETLIARDVHGACRMSKRSFLSLVNQLRPIAEKLPAKKCDPSSGKLPFVIVIKREKAPIDETMTRVVRAGKSGHVSMSPVEPDQFATIDRVTIPGGDAYLLLDIDRGAETLNVRPEDAMKIILKKRRSPLTIEEGVAIVLLYPDFLQKNNCYSLLASRRSDQRVPAIWIDGTRRPKLGWCWDRNPHTWLGSASAKKRVGF